MEPEKPSSFFFRFEDLRVYNKALDYVAWVYEATKSFPEYEENRLTSHFQRASQNIAVHIAEGSGRTKAQFISYLKMSKSSIRECIVITTIAQKMNYMNEEQIDDSRFYLIEMTKMVGALITSLQRTMRPENSPGDDDDEDMGNQISTYERFTP